MTGQLAQLDLGGKYLTFKLQEETFGLGILKVQEIIGIMAITQVPRTPSFIRGVINLRGKVIPVVDSRAKFDMPGTSDTEKTCIIVVQVARSGGSVTMGLIVDEVAEVVEIKSEQIEPAPSFGSSVDTSFVMGMGKVGEKVVMLLDADRVLSGEEVGVLQQITPGDVTN